MANTAQKLKTANLVPVVGLKPKEDEKQPKIHFPVRPPLAVTCPLCWKEQRASRDSCWCCGAGFIYENEPQRQRP